MGHVICSAKTGPIQSIVKLNVFNYFEEKSKVALHKYEKAVECNNEIICILLLILVIVAVFQVRIRIFNQINNIYGYVMDAKVSHKPCSCPSFKILYILLGLKPVQHLVRVLF
jgi:hypothetical protein